MSLRLRMFIIIGSVFLLIFLIAQIYEGHITRNRLVQTRVKLIKDIEQVNSLKQQEIDKYLIDTLEKQQAETNEILERVSEQEWLSSSTLINNNKQIDFVQNINEDHLMSMVILDSPLPRLVREIEHGEKFPLYAAESELFEGNWIRPFVASRISKHITKPITLLSQATQKMAEGRLDEITLPPIKKPKKDEIESLYQSFSEPIEIYSVIGKKEDKNES